MFLDLDNTMKLVFELRKQNDIDTNHVKYVQELTLNSNKPFSGLKGALGLYSSNEWWENIKNGNFRELIITGTISRLYVAGQDDNRKINSFDMIDNDGNTISSGIYLNNPSDLSLFEIGKKVSIFYIYDELKNGEYIDLVIEMAVSK